MRLLCFLAVTCVTFACAPTTDDGDGAVSSGRDVDGALDASPDGPALDGPAPDGPADAGRDLALDGPAEDGPSPDGPADAAHDLALDGPADGAPDGPPDAAPDMAVDAAVSCRAPIDCLDRFWDIRCVGHWSCTGLGCEEVCDDVGCGDGRCDPEGGESATSCFLDCRRDTACDDGTMPECPMPAPECDADEILAWHNGCHRCVNPDTCLPWGEPECAGDADCPPAEVCDPCGSSSCPVCADCVSACRAHGCETEPEPACDMVRPECGVGGVAVVREGCWVCVGLNACEPLPPDDCAAEGTSVPVIPNAPACCEGLEPIGCDRPIEGGCPPDPCVGAVVCADCGDNDCGPGENACNCPGDCGGLRGSPGRGEDPGS